MISYNSNKSQTILNNIITINSRIYKTIMIILEFLTVHLNKDIIKSIILMPISSTLLRTSLSYKYHQHPILSSFRQVSLKPLEACFKKAAVQNTIFKIKAPPTDQIAIIATLTTKATTGWTTKWRRAVIQIRQTLSTIATFRMKWSKISKMYKTHMGMLRVIFRGHLRMLEIIIMLILWTFLNSKFNTLRL